MPTPHRLHIVRPNPGLNPGHTPQAGRGAGLLMTAALVPPLSAVSRADPAARLADYLDALAFYLSLPTATLDRVLFVDNSDADIGPVLDAARRLAGDKTVEVLSFQGNDHPPQCGKAYGEFRLMDYGLAHSALFAPDDVVWKVTGRLKGLNRRPWPGPPRGTPSTCSTICTTCRRGWAAATGAATATWICGSSPSAARPTTPYSATPGGGASAASTPASCTDG